MIKIRPLKETDIAQAAAIVGKNYSKKWEKTSASEIKSMFSSSVINPQYYVAEENKEIVGFAGYIQSWMDYNIYQIFWVNVSPKNQGKGIGRMLVQHVIDVIKKKKSASLIQLTASIKNAPFYKKQFGFKTIQRFSISEHHLMSLDVRKSK